MKDFTGKIAVITGGGTGMGRELARQLAAEGCSVAMCDVSAANMAQTRALCEKEAAQGTRVMTFVADVSDEAALLGFRDAVGRELDTDRIHLLFNNAGIGGGGSFVTGERSEWEKTFNVCWNGVYLTTRAFMPMLLAADEGHIVNTSSVNGFWATLGPAVSHTAYPAAKFAVKGFTEALITDLRLNAPHVKCSVVMPGHIGTEIVANSRKVLSGNESDTLDEAALAQARKGLASRGVAADSLTDDQIRALSAEMARRFRDDAPTTAAQAAKIILDGVKAERWRILVGPDAGVIDEMVRDDPDEAYESAFFQKLAERANWRLGN
ncbi:MAG TPA: SDR family NAD(P)-dependent oxidoreductase [Caulobacteraceae bacterium]|jgi:NAD(P)-dependent dehydrogenase (short-subunit alcohol dehydrogenase family)